MIGDSEMTTIVITYTANTKKIMILPWVTPLRQHSFQQRVHASVGVPSIWAVLQISFRREGVIPSATVLVLYEARSDRLVLIP
jgi:hypothetical protein